MNNCEVMLNDVKYSKRLHTQIIEEKLQGQLRIPFDVLVVSVQFWPELKEETLKIPREVHIINVVQFLLFVSNFISFYLFFYRVWYNEKLSLVFGSSEMCSLNIAYDTLHKLDPIYALRYLAATTRRLKSFSLGDRGLR